MPVEITVSITKQAGIKKENSKSTKKSGYR
jgi:hypothetical protein